MLFEFLKPTAALHSVNNLLTTAAFSWSNRSSQSETDNMELTNIAQTGGPTAVHAKMDTTLSSLGINVCHCLTASPTTNPTNMAPDSFHQFSVDNNMGTWWAMFTQEEYNSMVPEDGNILLSIPGATRMPRFD